MKSVALSAYVALTVASMTPVLAADDQIKVGIVQATSGGSAALYGTMSKNAELLAVDEINESGVLGKSKLVPIYEDDAGDRGQAVNIFQRLIFQEKVSVLFGPTLATSAFAADPIAQKAQVLVIASSNTAPGITGIGDFI